MAIIINDYKPSGETVEVQLPGSKKRFQVPLADDVLDGEWMARVNSADTWETIADIFEEEEAKTIVRGLKKPQLQEFIKAWTGDKAGN